jgi:O-antigen ligase
MKHNLPVNTPTWNIQPIHNVWLLILVEKGLLGLLLALSILYLLFINVLKNLYKRGAIIWFGISSILLVISFFDHYLYTIFQGQIILWGWVGWGIAICDSPNQQES